MITSIVFIIFRGCFDKQSLLPHKKCLVIYLYENQAKIIVEPCFRPQLVYRQETENLNPSDVANPTLR